MTLVLIKHILLVRKYTVGSGGVAPSAVDSNVAVIGELLSGEQDS